MKRIRNFSIIAHIDHGKSTLADRLLERTGTIPARKMVDQVLDQMELERERGITIKAQAVRLLYRARDGAEYELNLIDTPGHVDFAYEVSRALAACEGALLVVDATQGVQAQTLAHLYVALDHHLTVVPVINKIDLPSADPERVKAQLEELGFERDEALLVSAKLGLGVDEVLEAVVRRIPPPRGSAEEPLRALIFDSKFDAYQGAIAYVRLFSGRVRVGDRVRLMQRGTVGEVSEVGVFTPAMTPAGQLEAGEVGYLAAGIKNIRELGVGDTITHDGRPAAEPLPGYRPALPMVFAGLYPVEAEEVDDLREALEKLQLNDAALSFEPESSAALGYGFRCGFLGLLHMEVVQERLEREFGLDLITTAPSVAYRVRLGDGSEVLVENPARLPDRSRIAEMAEPYVRAEIFTPAEFVGPVMELCHERRGSFLTMEYPDAQRARLEYRLPLAEIMFDFFDALKSRTRGYATLDYRFDGYEPSDLVKLEILVNGEPVDALSVIVHRSRAEERGRELAQRLRELIPRQQFEVPIQAAVGGRIVARETIRALRKDVLAKCYGGDVTRKRKLLEKQREGKKRMKQVGRVEIPQEAFLAVLGAAPKDERA
ncbi:MAG: translation elongation factor 4 [Bacillota bacterium]|nr:translation elongation factor 4 [Bacillota bacterium]